MAPKVIHGLRDYITSHSTMMRPQTPEADGDLKRLLDIKKAEDEVLVELNKDWPPVGGTGLVDVCDGYGCHFTGRDTHNAERKRNYDTPDPAFFYCQADYKQHDNLPKGPKHGSSFYYAGGLQGVGVLTFSVWAHDRPVAFYTYCSDVAEQSSLYFLACLRDLFQVTGAHNYPRARVWLDSGPHFKSGDVFGFFDKHWTRIFPDIEFAELIFFCGGHGKGIIDGYFATTITRYVNMKAKRFYIGEVAEYVGALKEGAQIEAVSDRNHFYHFAQKGHAPFKHEMPQDILVNTKALRDDKCGISSNLYFKFERAPHGGGMVSAAPMLGLAEEVTILEYVTEHIVEGAYGPPIDWRRYYRSKHPEKMKAKIGSLMRCWNAVKGLAGGGLKPDELSGRLPAKVDRADAFNRACANKKRRADEYKIRLLARKARGPCVADGSESSSSSDSSDSASACSSTSVASGGGD